MKSIIYSILIFAGVNLGWSLGQLVQDNYLYFAVSAFSGIALLTIIVLLGDKIKC